MRDVQSGTVPRAPYPAFATRAAVIAHIAAAGHEMEPAAPIDVYDARLVCLTCGAALNETTSPEGVLMLDVDDRLLAPCQEPDWASYDFVAATEPAAADTDAGPADMAEVAR